MIGTGINVMAVLLGSTIGLAAGRRVPAWFGRMATAVIGLLTLVLGIKLACGSEDLFLLLIALLVGGALGTGLNIEGRLARLGEVFMRRWPESSKGAVPQGFVTASLLADSPMLLCMVRILRICAGISSSRRISSVINA